MYCVGDKVRIVSSRMDPRSEPDMWNKSGHMDKWLGQEMTIRVVELGVYTGIRYKMEEDRDEGLSRSGWSWIDNMIEGLADDDEINLFTTLSSVDIGRILML